MKRDDQSFISLAIAGGKNLDGAQPGTLLPRPVIPEKWIWHFRALAGLRARLTEDRATQMAQAAESIDVDTDSADSATDEFDHDLALAMWESKDDLLQEVDAAIQRIRDGWYGFCEETGKVIPAARLMAMPWTRYTLEAEARLEARGQKVGPQLGQLHPIAPPGEKDIEISEGSDNQPETERLDLDQLAAPADDCTP